jgi:hypothetical protein
VRIFQGIPVQNFIGQFYNQPAISGNTGFFGQPTLPPSTVPALFNWISYGASFQNPNIAVLLQTINLQGARQLLDSIRSVRIDNTGNNVPVYVQFPDTQFTVVAPPNTIVQENVITAQYNALVVAEGFAGSSPSQVGSTAVFFNNFFLQVLNEQEIAQELTLQLASSTITRGNSIYQQNYGVPALGDQFISPISIGLTGAPLPVTVFDFNEGFIYLTELVMSVNAAESQAGAGSVAELFFESTGIAGIFAEVPFTIIPIGGNSSFVSYSEIFRANGQYKLDGTQTWRFRVATPSAFLAGNALLYATFTTNPN